MAMYLSKISLRISPQPLHTTLDRSLHYRTDMSKTVLITGANTGMGLQTAINLACSNTKVILGCRNLRAGSEAAKIITKSTKNRGVIVYELDLASFTSIHRFASTINEREQVDTLINNAGVFMLPLRRTSDNIEMHFGVNYLGHFLLTNLLLEKLKKSASGRIINITANVPRYPAINFDDINSEKSYNRIQAVVQSKQALLLFTKFLASELKGSNVTVNSVDPGLVLNEFGRNRDYWYGYFQVSLINIANLYLPSFFHS